MIAVMGPSGNFLFFHRSNKQGAGKTSLLEILADRNKPTNVDDARILELG